MRLFHYQRINMMVLFYFISSTEDFKNPAQKLFEGKTNLPMHINCNSFGKIEMRTAFLAQV